MKLRTATVIAVTMIASACAKNPESIAPMSMPPNAYSGLSCVELDVALQQSRAQLAQAEADQRQAVTGDAVGVFLVGVPMSSLTGADKEGVVAQKKGEVIAIEIAQRNQDCGTS